MVASDNTGPYSVRIVMDDKESSLRVSWQSMPRLTEEQLAGYDACSLYGGSASRLPSYEVFRGIVPATWIILELAISLNAIHPDEYLTDMLLKPHRGDRCSGR